MENLINWEGRERVLGSASRFFVFFRINFFGPPKMSCTCAWPLTYIDVKISFVKILPSGTFSGYDNHIVL